MAGLNDEKFRKMQDEMSRFEEEIGLPLPDVVPLPPDKRFEGMMPPPPNVPMMAPLPPMPPPPPGLMPHGAMPPAPPGFLPPGALPPGPMPVSGMPPCPPGHLPGGPMPPSMMSPVPRGLGPPGMPHGMIPSGPPLMPGPPVPHMFQPGPPMMPQPLPPNPPPGTMPMPLPPQFPAQFTSNIVQPPRPPEKPMGPVVLSSTPMLYGASSQVDMTNPQPAEPVSSNRTIEAASAVVNQESKKKKLEKPVVTVTTEPVVPQTQSKNKKEKKNRKLMRTAGGQTWEDSTLGEWDDDDFRLFCGDLGNDVTDEVLSRAFSKYASFFKAKVIRDKRTNKTKGFGFVSFKDPQDFIKATKEMNGRYVGSRPIKLRKSTWKNRSLDVVRKKDKEKTVLINMLTGK